MKVTLGMASGGEAALAPAPKSRPGGPDMLQLDGVSALGADGAQRLDAVTLTLRSGEIVGIAGVEGNGQTELGLILAGLLQPSSGQVVIAGQDMTGRSPAEFTAAGMGVVPEDRHLVGCITAMSLTDNLYLDRTRVPLRFGLMRRSAMRETAEALMKRFDIRAASPDVAFGSLSGGNQQKAVLARELTAPRLKVLLAAQPTRGLDVGAVEAVYALIREACKRGVAVLLISSELDEILTVADRVLVLYRGRIVGERPASADQRETVGRLMAGGTA